MKSVKIGFIHTSQVLIPQFTALCSELLPDFETFHVDDDSLVRDVIAFGALHEPIIDRLKGHLRTAEKDGVDAIMVTCSSMGPAIDIARLEFNVPILRVDQAMAKLSVSTAGRIGIIATVATTLGPTADLIRQMAQEAGKEVEIVIGLCDGALQKLIAGETETHDRMVTEKMLSLVDKVELIVLAQASMARVAHQWTAEQCPIPVLTSPRLAIESLAQRFRHPA